MSRTSVRHLPNSRNDFGARGAQVQRFERDVMPHAGLLLRGARRLTRTEADAEDLLQETLLRAYTGLPTFTPGTNAKAWLFRIMHNQWINNYRRRQRRLEEVPVDQIADQDLFAIGRHGNGDLRSAEDEALRAWSNPGIAAALDALPEGYRTAVYYADVEGYSYADIAALMDIPLGTVMSRVFRGRARLRSALATAA